jgi:hypothetical protein
VGQKAYLFVEHIQPISIVIQLAPDKTKRATCTGGSFGFVVVCLYLM